jgi:MFS transporter, DHA2 family, multidrug resistance protein
VTISMQPRNDEFRHSLLICCALALIAFADRTTSGATSFVLPYTQGDLALSGDEAPFLTLSYNAAYYAGILLSPWILRRSGRVRYLLACVTAYGFASLLCAISTSLPELMTFRAVQGLAEGGFFLAGFLTIFANLSPKTAALFVLAYAATSQFGTGMAPFLAGAIAYNNSWRLMYVALAVVALLAVALIRRSVSQSAIDTGLRSSVPGEPIDIPGAVLLALAVGAYSYLTAFGELRDWLNSSDVAAAFVLFVSAALGFVLWERFGARNPLIPMTAFSRKNVLLGIPLALAVGFPALGTTIQVRYLQEVLNFPLPTAGAVIALRALAIAISAPLGSILTLKGADTRLVIAGGFALSMFAFLWESSGITSGADFGTFVGAELLIGAGFGLTYGPLLVTVATNLPFGEIPVAVAVMNLSFAAAGSFANSWLTTIYDHRSAKHLSDLAGSVAPYRAPVSTTLQAGGSLKLHGLTQLVSQQAAVVAFADVALYVAAIAALAIPVTLLLRRANPHAMKDWLVSLASPRTSAADVRSM